MVDVVARSLHDHVNVPALQACLSGTFLHTLPQLWSRHWRGTLCWRVAVRRRCWCPPNGLHADKTVKAAQGWSINIIMRCIHHLRWKMSAISIQTISVLFALVQAMWKVISAWYNLSKLSVTNVLHFDHQWKTVRQLSVSFRDLWHNQLWQCLEEGFCKPVLGVWDVPFSRSFRLAPWQLR